ncbi:hypothetical protein Pro02_13770 [Planobispora rosea]|uniref:Uncharacterized protein n=1 Tax=Planobispora rosea TaxID=35762 RepID=A0A8J3WAM9_PLARO|nr:hypothetical protein Pro02_13770 [Planobispora rosea]
MMIRHRLHTARRSRVRGTSCVRRFPSEITRSRLSRPGRKRARLSSPHEENRGPEYRDDEGAPECRNGERDPDGEKDPDGGGDRPPGPIPSSPDPDQRSSGGRVITRSSR